MSEDNMTEELMDIEGLIEVLKTHPPEVKISGELWVYINKDHKYYRVGGKSIPLTIDMHDARQLGAIS